MRRAIKLVFHEHRINRPYCGTALIYHLTAAMIQLIERTCLKCGKEFAIENNLAKCVPSKERPQELEKLSQDWHPAISRKNPAGAAE